VIISDSESEGDDTTTTTKAKTKTIKRQSTLDKIVLEYPLSKKSTIGALVGVVFGLRQIQSVTEGKSWGLIGGKLGRSRQTVLNYLAMCKALMARHESFGPSKMSLGLGIYVKKYWPGYNIADLLKGPLKPYKVSKPILKFPFHLDAFIKKMEYPISQSDFAAESWTEQQYHDNLYADSDAVIALQARASD
jgi:hypothetical protein